MVGGVLGMLVSRGLRTVIGRAESSVREQDLFGKYRLIRQVASGGMGTVHEALYCPEGGFERRVAIKRIHPHLAEQDSFVQAFRVEAELCARLVHSNIVQVFDFGRVGDTYFLAMEYVDGLTLLSFLRRMSGAQRVLSPAVVAYLGRQILGGLAYSHSGAIGTDGKPLRVIHRDLSPANVLLSTNGEVKISDFGLARALKDAASTRTRTVAGHAGYMAPEQAQGLPLDERCDLFGLAVMLWELLAGRRLFQRDNEATTLLALVSEPIAPISSVRPDLDASWDVFFERGLARDPVARFASAGEMAAVLDRVESPGGRADVALLAGLVDEALSLPERAPSRALDQTVRDPRPLDDSMTAEPMANRSRPDT
jgi:serine/threonine-protein kinase